MTDLESCVKSLRRHLEEQAFYKLKDYNEMLADFKEKRIDMPPGRVEEALEALGRARGLAEGYDAAVRALDYFNKPSVYVQDKPKPRRK